MYANQNGAHTMNSMQQNFAYNAVQQQQQLQQHQQQQQQQQQQQLPQSQQSQSQQSTKAKEKKSYVRIIEQPASKALRFRYECEGRSAGSIPGANSTPENKTFPAIEIVGYKGKAVVVVSCVTKDQPYRPHPHNLVGKDGCKKGVCTVQVNEDTMRSVFSNLGIQCVKKKDIEAALKAREEIRVDPFKTGFEHRSQPSSIDLNSVRLCFQVFIEKEGRFTVPLPPVVSEPIYDKKSMSDLVICRLCSCSTTVLGNTHIMLLCEKVAKDDIQVRFFEETNGQMTWEAFGEFQQTDVHKQTAIAFKTPRYHTLDIEEPAKVFIQLRRPSDGVTSEALPFDFIPLDSDPENLRRKRQKTCDDAKYFLLRQQPTHQHNAQRPNQQATGSSRNPNLQTIKVEPNEIATQHFGLYRNQAEKTPSPQPLSASPANIVCNLSNTNSTPYQAAHSVASPNEPSNSPMDVQSGYISQQPQRQTSMHQQHQQQQFQHQLYAVNWTTNASNNAYAPNATPFQVNWRNNTAAPTACVSNANDCITQNVIPGANTNRTAAQQFWNIPATNNLQQQQVYPYLPQQQLQYQQPSPNPPNMPQIHNILQNTENAANLTAKGVVADNNSNNGPTVSNLFNFDSSQLVQIDSADQQNIQLDTEDLQISNLSLTT